MMSLGAAVFSITLLPGLSKSPFAPGMTISYEQGGVVQSTWAYDPTDPQLQVPATVGIWTENVTGTTYSDESATPEAIPTADAVTPNVEGTPSKRGSPAFPAPSGTPTPGGWTPTPAQLIWNCPNDAHGWPHCTVPNQEPPRSGIPQMFVGLQVEGLENLSWPGQNKWVAVLNYLRDSMQIIQTIYRRDAGVDLLVSHVNIVNETLRFGSSNLVTDHVRTIWTQNFPIQAQGIMRLVSYSGGGNADYTTCQDSTLGVGIAGIDFTVLPNETQEWPSLFYVAHEIGHQEFVLGHGGCYFLQGATLPTDQCSSGDCYGNGWQPTVCPTTEFDSNFMSYCDDTPTCTTTGFRQLQLGDSMSRVAWNNVSALQNMGCLGPDVATIPATVIRQQDTDDDGVPDLWDNCPKVANPLQEDRNMDGVGDACSCAIVDPATSHTPWWPLLPVAYLIRKRRKRRV